MVWLMIEMICLMLIRSVNGLTDRFAEGMINLLVFDQDRWSIEGFINERDDENEVTNGSWFDVVARLGNYFFFFLNVLQNEFLLLCLYEPTVFLIGAIVSCTLHYGKRVSLYLVKYSDLSAYLCIIQFLVVVRCDIDNRCSMMMLFNL